MWILNKKLENINYEDIVNFCAEKHIEGTELDYKKDLPRNGLSKTIVSFSNTRGGLIIIGVEEDTRNGLPLNTPGIELDSKIIEKINQQAGEIFPVPAYEIRLVNNPINKTNVFILIRVLEGDKCPYYLHNNSIIYVRTGNITRLIDTASPDDIEKIFEKRKLSLKYRAVAIRKARETFSSAIERFKPQDTRSPIFSKSKYDDKMLTIETILTPFYPKNEIANPRELFDHISNKIFRLPDSLFVPRIRAESIPDGVMKIDFTNNSNYISCLEIFSTGLVFSTQSRNIEERESEKVKYLYYLENFMDYLYSLLIFSRELYEKYQFLGSNKLIIKISFPHDYSLTRVSESTFHTLTQRKGLMDSYTWNIDLDTNILTSVDLLKNMYIELFEKIHWDLGFDDPKEKEDIINYMNKKNLNFKNDA